VRPHSHLTSRYSSRHLTSHLTSRYSSRPTPAPGAHGGILQVSDLRPHEFKAASFADWLLVFALLGLLQVVERVSYVRALLLWVVSVWAVNAAAASGFAAAGIAATAVVAPDMKSSRFAAARSRRCSAPQRCSHRHRHSHTQIHTIYIRTHTYTHTYTQCTYTCTHKHTNE